MTDERFDKAANLLQWLRSNGRRVWVDPKTGLEFEDEWLVGPETAMHLLHSHDDIVLLLKAEAALARIAANSKG